MLIFVIKLFIITTILEARAEYNETFINAITPQEQEQEQEVNATCDQNECTDPISPPSQINVTIYDSPNVTDGIAEFPIPFHVSVQMITDKQIKHICAGTIIDESFVLTAAHCFHKSKNPKRMSVVVGSNTLSTTDGIRYNVLKIIIHDFYEPLLGWDIALLKIEPKFEFNGENIDKINLNSTAEVHESTDTYMIGWGKTKGNEIQTLEIVSFQTIDNKKCKSRGFHLITKTELCAISYKGRGACDGDSGGPLVNVELNTQLGILSYGRYLCMKGRIYAFTYIYPLIDWIFERMQQYR